MCELMQDHWLLWLTYKKIYQFLSRLLIVGLVWKFICDFYGRLFAILCNAKAVLKSLKSLKLEKRQLNHALASKKFLAGPLCWILQSIGCSKLATIYFTCLRGSTCNCTLSQ